MLITTKLPSHAEAYYSGKEQLTSTLTAIANHIHTPPKSERRKPDQITARDLNRLKEAQHIANTLADLFDLEIR